MIFIEARPYYAKKKGKCKECKNGWREGQLVYHLPKGRFPGDHPLSICVKCYNENVVGDCHGHA